jgi:hypothetical protein
MPAIFSPDRRHRYVLRRDVAPLDGKGTVAFIGLNPSTADETQDDPTIRRCISFARRWGFAELVMLNLYAWRATDPSELLAPGTDPFGSENLGFLQDESLAADLVVVAWGTHGALDGPGITNFLPKPLHCLGRTKDGHPRHPLYVSGETELEIYAE